MLNSYEYYMENIDECEADLIALQLSDETLEYDFDVVANNQLPF